MAATADNVQRQLGGQLFAGDARPAWLLVDAMGVDVREVVPETVSEDAIHVIPLGRKDIPSERYPYLVRICEHDVELLRASVQWAFDEQADPDNEQQHGFAIGGWLQAAVEPARLARHLARCMDQRMPHLGRKYFRWADRRVLEWMWPAMNNAERTDLLGPATHWWTLDRIGQAHDLTAAPATDANRSWRITPEAWRHAQDCEPVQALIRGWERFAPLPSNYLGQAAQAVRGACSLGLTDMAQIVLMATCALQSHPQLHTHPRIKVLVDEALRNNLSLAEALDVIPDPDGWHQLRDELNGATASANSPRRARHG